MNKIIGTIEPEVIITNTANPEGTPVCSHIASDLILFSWADHTRDGDEFGKN